MKKTASVNYHVDISRIPRSVQKVRSMIASQIPLILIYITDEENTSNHPGL